MSAINTWKFNTYMMTDWMSQPKGNYLLIALVSFATTLLFFPQLSWVVFSGDDSHLMRVSLQHGWAAPYFSPEYYRELSVANFTPIPLSVYKTILTIFGQRPLVLLLFMLLMGGMMLTLAGALVYKLTNRVSLALICVALILSSQSMHTLLSRFYTMHYLIGLIFALSAFLLFVSVKRNTSGTLLVILFAFLAMVSKEVYVVAPAILALIALRNGDRILPAGLLGAFVVYWIWRSYMVAGGVSIGSEESYFKGFWTIEPDQWKAFFLWYVKTNLLLLAAMLLAMTIVPRFFFPMFIAALAFGLPGLAVTHGIQEFNMHADRIFLAMNVALAIAATISLSMIKTSNVLYKRPAVAFVFLFSLASHLWSIPHYKTMTATSPDYRISRFLLDNRPGLVDRTIFVPVNFIQGDLVRVNRLLNEPSFELTQNCQTALLAPEGALIVFDSSGEMRSKEWLADTCMETDLNVVETMPPSYRDGYLQWRLEAPEGYTAGVLFVDRVFAVPIAAFSQQLVKPSQGERYQVFATDWQYWWFSEIKEIQQ
ncbi:MAG: hypothetical protein WD772_02075 [Pseudohongiellaceae bacterium]